MTKPSSREVLERLAPIRATPLVPSGSPAAVMLRAAGELPKVNTVLAAHALIRRGVDAQLALTVIDAMVADGEAVVKAPTVEAGDGLLIDLRDAGIEPEIVRERVHA